MFKDKKYIKSVLELFDNLHIVSNESPLHIGQPLPDPHIGRPYISYNTCMHKNCNKCFNTGNELIKHLKQFKVYTPSYHKLHEDIIQELGLTENKIKEENIKKCPSWICKEPEFYSSEELITHFKRLGIKPFWKQGMKFEKEKEYEFNKNIKLYEATECIICLYKKPNVIFNKCMHLCYCVNCYDSHIKLNSTLKCPLCREFFTKIYPY